MKKTAALFMCALLLCLCGCHGAPGGERSGVFWEAEKAGAFIENAGERSGEIKAVSDRRRTGANAVPFAGEPSYIKIYSPLSPMPLDWYQKYRIITDFQTF
ncbi:MAG: hypothetical protein IKD89_04110 [Clostridia bacterium]|nr:hypothetical protein [Clostridia bacterium]